VSNLFFPAATLTYGDLLNQARDRSPFFDPTRIPGGVAARLASAVQQALVSQTVRRDPDMFRLTTTIDATTIVPGTPVQLPAYSVVTRAELVWGSPVGFPVQLPLIPESRKDDNQTSRAAYLNGGAITFTGRTEDYTNVLSVVVNYVPPIAPFTAETDSLALPDDAIDALAATLALRFAFRVNGMPMDGMDPSKAVIQLDTNAFLSDARQAQDDWFQRVVKGVRVRAVSNRNGIT